MPADFDACEAEGGKIITKTLKNSQYVHLCKDKKGKWHQGYAKKRRTSSYDD